MTVYTFAISALDTGRLVALAVVAPEARYCSLLPVGAGRIDRRFVPLPGWKAIDGEFALGLDPGLWRADSPVAQALGLSKADALRYLSALPVDVPHVGAAEALDAFLRAAVAPTQSPSLEVHQCHVWVCETHPGESAEHDGCSGAAMPCPWCYQGDEVPPLEWDRGIPSTDDEE